MEATIITKEKDLGGGNTALEGVALKFDKNDVCIGASLVAWTSKTEKGLTIFSPRHLIKFLTLPQMLDLVGDKTKLFPFAQEQNLKIEVCQNGRLFIAKPLQLGSIVIGYNIYRKRFLLRPRFTAQLIESVLYDYYNPVWLEVL